MGWLLRNDSAMRFYSWRASLCDQPTSNKAELLAGAHLTTQGPRLWRTAVATAADLGWPAPTKMVAQGDSALSVRHWQGKGRLRDPGLVAMVASAEALRPWLPQQWTWQHIPRAFNQAADHEATMAVADALRALTAGAVLEAAGQEHWDNPLGIPVATPSRVGHSTGDDFRLQESLPWASLAQALVSDPADPSLRNLCSAWMAAAGQGHNSLGVLYRPAGGRPGGAMVP